MSAAHVIAAVAALHQAIANWDALLAQDPEIKFEAGERMVRLRLDDARILLQLAHDAGLAL